MSPPDVPPPNCAGCGAYHGSETQLVFCLTARIRTLETGPPWVEFQRLRRFEARFIEIKRAHDALAMTPGGVAESRRLAGKRNLE